MNTMLKLTSFYRGNLSRAVELCMTDVLIQLIEDVGLSDPESVKIILDQFEEHDKVNESLQSDILSVFADIPAI